jgi:hypothetical protein
MKHTWEHCGGEAERAWTNICQFSAGERAADIFVGLAS